MKTHIAVGFRITGAPEKFCYVIEGDCADDVDILRHPDLKDVVARGIRAVTKAAGR